MKRGYLFLAYGIGSGFLCITISSYWWWISLKQIWYGYLGGWILGLVIVLLALLPRCLISQLSERQFLLLAIVFFILSRLLWVGLIGTKPTSDFAYYNYLAHLFSRGQPLDAILNNDRVYMLYSWGYPLVLGCIYAVFGESLFIAKLSNILVGTMSVWLTYLLGKELLDEKWGRFAVLLFIFWPTQLFFSSILATEHLGTMATLAVAVTFVRAVNHSSHKWINWIATGILLAFAFAIRSALMVLLIAGIITLLLLYGFSRKTIFHIFILTTCFWLTNTLYRHAVLATYHIDAPTQIYWHLLIGTNYDTGGTWNQPDAEKFMTYSSFNDALTFARAESLRRITSAPLRFIELAMKKEVVFWRDDGFGVYWSQLEFLKTPVNETVVALDDALYAISRSYHLFILFFGVSGLYVSLNINHQKGVILIILMLAGGTFLHGILEVQTRYHYVYEPFLIIMAGIGLRHFYSALHGNWVKEFFTRMNNWRFGKG